MPRKKPKRRKPQKRKRVIETLQVKDIPYSKYRIEWIDCVSDSGWASEKEFWDTFNKKHNPKYYYAKNKEKEKEQEKNKKQKNYTFKYKIFRKQD